MMHLQKRLLRVAKVLQHKHKGHWTAVMMITLKNVKYLWMGVGKKGLCFFEWCSDTDI